MKRKKSPIKEKKIRVVGYARVSTDNQKDEGTIEVQTNAIKEYAAAHSYEVVAMFNDEGVSGSLEHRPALAEMFDYIEQNGGIKYVIVFKLDRLARDLYIQEHLIRKMSNLGVELVSINEPDLAGNDPLRKAFRQFMGIVAELEKSFITMRMSAGRLNKIKVHKRHAGGRVPVGYVAVDGDIIKDPARLGVIEKIFELRERGLSLRQIAALLNGENIPAPRGGKWAACTILYVLNNPVYKGKLRYLDIAVDRPDLKIKPERGRYELAEPAVA